MGVKVSGMPEMLSIFQEEEILWPKKRRALIAAAEQAREDAQGASAEIRDTGFLERNWKWSFFNDDGIATANVYSKATHDIYNELGSPKNMKHVGFYSRNVDQNMDKYYDIIMEEILDDYK